MIMSESFPQTLPGAYLRPSHSVGKVIWRFYELGAMNSQGVHASSHPLDADFRGWSPDGVMAPFQYNDFNKIQVALGGASSCLQ